MPRRTMMMVEMAGGRRQHTMEEAWATSRPREKATAKAKAKVTSRTAVIASAPAIVTATGRATATETVTAMATETATAGRTVLSRGLHLTSIRAANWWKY